jgi:putative transposase
VSTCQVDTTIMIGDIAHICNRGVEKRKIFLDRGDHARFVENLFLLNNSSGKLRTKHKDVFYAKEEISLRQEKLVEVLKWSLLPNHYHLLLYEVKEGGILEFTKRLGNAYTKYFNTKHEGRSGYLFQNSAKIVPILNEQQFLYVPVYIDLNCVDLLYPDWKNRKIDSKKALDFLIAYEWSSFANYYDDTGREGVVAKDLFYKLFDTNSTQYKKEVEGFLAEPIGIEGVDLAG